MKDEQGLGEAIFNYSDTVPYRWEMLQKYGTPEPGLTCEAFKARVEADVRRIGSEVMPALVRLISGGYGSAFLYNPEEQKLWEYRKRFPVHPPVTDRPTLERALASPFLTTFVLGDSHWLFDRPFIDLAEDYDRDDYCDDED